MKETHTLVWAGIEHRKGRPWVAVVDDAGLIVRSHKIVHDEIALVEEIPTLAN